MAPGSSSSHRHSMAEYLNVDEYPSVYIDYFDQVGVRNPPIRIADLPSSSSLLHKLESITAVSDLLECPVCVNVLYPPIHQCPNGHTICLQCKTLVQNRCPICRYEIGNIRCVALEKVAELLELPCKNQFMGCEDRSSYEQRLKHEQTCKFKPFHCPYASAECNVTGDVKFLVAHLKNDHNVVYQNGSIFSHQYVKAEAEEVESATWMMILINCFGHHFCLHFETFYLGLAPVYMAFVRFMGEEQDAKKFSYILDVGLKGRRLTWQGVPRSIRDSHLTVRDSLDGLIIHRNMGLFFSGGNGMDLHLDVTGRIWKEE